MPRTKKAPSTRKAPETANGDPRETSQLGPRALKDPRSVEYAWQTLAYIRTQYELTTVSLSHWEKALAEAEQHTIWDRIPPEKPYGSLEAMLKAELGVSKEESLRQKAAQIVAQNVSAAAPRGTNQYSEDGTKMQKVPSSRGNRADVRVARLKRDHPAIAGRLAAGEFRSVAAAERAARGEEPHPPRRVPAPLERAQKAVLALSAADRKRLAQWLAQQDS
jgi:hypothetical protein